MQSHDRALQDAYKEIDRMCERMNLNQVGPSCLLTPTGIPVPTRIRTVALLIVFVPTFNFHSGFLIPTLDSQRVWLWSDTNLSRFHILACVLSECTQA